MSANRKIRQDLSSLSREELEIRLRQCVNDLNLTKEESRENSLKYMEMVGELGERNMELQSLKDGLEDVLKARNAELLLARESQGDFSKAQSSSGFQALLERSLEEAKESISSQGGTVSLSCPDKLHLENAAPLPAIIRSLSRGLLSCCGKDASLEVAAECSRSSVSVRLRVSGKSVDKDLLSSLLKSCETPESWEGLPGLISGLTGWIISPDYQAGGLILSILRQETPSN